MRQITALADPSSATANVTATRLEELLEDAGQGRVVHLVPVACAADRFTHGSDVLDDVLGRQAQVMADLTCGPLCLRPRRPIARVGSSAADVESTDRRRDGINLCSKGAQQFWIDEQGTSRSPR